MATLYIFLTILCAFSVFAKHEFYEGYGLYGVSVRGDDEMRIFHQIEKKLDLDVWSRILPNRAGSVLVSPAQKDDFFKLLQSAGIQYSVEYEDVRELLHEQDGWIAESANKTTTLSARSGLSFEQYHRYEAVDAYLTVLAEQYPEVVTVVSGGTSYEGRDIKYLRISTTNFQENTKPVIVIQSLAHAREWITLPAILYAIQKLVIDVTDPDVIENVDWIVIPIVNPDGYEYSHTTRRLQRKNRSVSPGIWAGFCDGVDLNRNYNFYWATDSSTLPCSETYHGVSSFSEPETAVVRDILDRYLARIKLFIDVHSFGSYILYGYGHTGQLPPNGLEVHLLGIQMAQAIDAVKLPANINYIVGNSALALYSASGLGSDYAQSLGIPLSYTYELPEFNRGQFVVNPTFIWQAAFETWEGLKVAARYVANTHRIENKT